MTRRVLVAAAVLVLATGILALWLGSPSLPQGKPSVTKIPGGIRLELVQIPNAHTPDVIAEQGPVQEPSSWCATPRRNEPLLRDAIRFGTAAENSFERGMNGIGRVPRSSIVIVKDEAICRRAAMIYNSENGDIGPVVVIRIDTRYLVGKPDFSEDADAYWRVQIYDEEWHLLTTYSQGS